MAYLRIPADTVASATRSSVGTTTDVALGGFPGQVANAVELSVDYQLTVDVETFNAGESVEATAAVDYTDDGGSTWTPIATVTASIAVGAPGGETDSASAGPTTFTATLGATDISDMQVRAVFTVTTKTGASTVTGSADITDWDISIHVPMGIIGGEDD